MSKIRKYAAFALLCALPILLCSCFRINADELYSVPKASDEYVKLQTKIDEVLASGAEYSPPIGGENRQSVQLTDIDGDGMNEAVAFFIARTEDNPLKIYIFQSEGEEYAVASVIEGLGTGIESVRFVDMDGDDVLEIIVGWQISSALKSVALYSLKGFQSTKLAQADYTSLVLTDVTGDGFVDLCAARIGTAEAPGALEVISLMTDGEVVSSTAHMSDGVESVTRLISGKLSDGVPAVFIDTKVSGGTITDVFCFSDGVLRNITRLSEGEPSPRIREDSSTDIDGDGIIEVPFLNALPQQSETSTYYSVDWCSFSSGGKRTVALSTYHNYSDEWYLIIPQEWVGRFSVRREDHVRGERTVVFSFVDPETFAETGEVRDFMRIYMLSGDNREERARIAGRFKLLEEGEKIYAAALFDAEGDYPRSLNEQELVDSFRLIFSEWLTG